MIARCQIDNADMSKENGPICSGIIDGSPTATVYQNVRISTGLGGYVAQFRLGLVSAGTPAKKGSTNGVFANTTVARLAARGYVSVPSGISALYPFID